MKLSFKFVFTVATIMSSTYLQASDLPSVDLSLKENGFLINNLMTQCSSLPDQNSVITSKCYSDASTSLLIFTQKLDKQYSHLKINDVVDADINFAYKACDELYPKALIPFFSPQINQCKLAVNIQKTFFYLDAVESLSN